MFFLLPSLRCTYYYIRHLFCPLPRITTQVWQWTAVAVVAAATATVRPKKAASSVHMFQGREKKTGPEPLIIYNLFISTFAYWDATPNVGIHASR